MTPAHHLPPIVGYAYVCDNADATQAVKVRQGEDAVVVERTGGPSNILGFWQIFRTESPTTCTQLTEVGTELTPGAVLVAVTWQRPYVVVIQS